MTHYQSCQRPPKVDITNGIPLISLNQGRRIHLGVARRYILGVRNPYFRCESSV